MDKNVGAYLQITLAMAIVGSSVVVSKIIVSDFPVFLSSGLRFAIASLVLVSLFIKLENGITKITRKDLFILFKQGFTGIFLFSVFLLYGLKLTNAAESGIITSTTPAVVGLILFLFLKKRLTQNKAVGISLTVLGILTVNYLETELTLRHNFLALVANLLIFGAIFGESLFTIFRKILSQAVSPLATAALVSVLGFFLFLPFSIYEASKFDFTELSIIDWFPIFYYAIVVTVIAFILWFQGVSKVPASTAAVFAGIIPISAVFLSVIALNGPVSLRHVLGALCIFLGIVFMTRHPGDVRPIKGKSVEKSNIYK